MATDVAIFLSENHHDNISPNYFAHKKIPTVALAPSG